MSTKSKYLGLEFSKGDIVRYPGSSFTGKILEITFDGRYVVQWSDGSTGPCEYKDLELVSIRRASGQILFTDTWVNNQLNRPPSQDGCRGVSKHHKTQEAYNNGKQIQMRDKASGYDYWIDTDFPQWFDWMEYRVKPSEVKVQVQVVRHQTGFVDILNVKGVKNLELTFCEDSSKLLRAEII